MLLFLTKVAVLGRSVHSVKVHLYCNDCSEISDQHFRIMLVACGHIVSSK